MPSIRKGVTAIGRYKLVLVEWDDSATPVSAWQWVDDYTVPEIVRCLSVGWLIAKTAKAIALAPNLGDVQHTRQQASGIMRIPLAAVLKITDL